MKETTRRNFVRDSIVAGAAATATAGPGLLARGSEASSTEMPIKIVAISCQPTKRQDHRHLTEGLPRSGQGRQPCD